MNLKHERGNVMKRISVTSSNVVSIGYDPISQILEVEFRDNAIYHYFDVPREIYEGLLDAESVGRFLHRHVKGVYDYSRV